MENCFESTKFSITPDLLEHFKMSIYEPWDQYIYEITEWNIKIIVTDLTFYTPINHCEMAEVKNPLNQKTDTFLKNQLFETYNFTL